MKKETSREIGSEFHSMPFENGVGLSFPGADYSLTFSGRTAIETVLHNLPFARRALLPSYCCDSMIEPFRKRGIEVSFFKVEYQDGFKIELSNYEHFDILLWCNYFGFKTPMPDMTEVLDKGGAIIEDITHSLFSEAVYSSQSSYLVASLRKWEAILCGGFCAANNGKLIKKPENLPDKNFLNHKQYAMDLKAEYLLSMDESKKPIFLSAFNELNEWIEENYSSLKMDPYSEKYLSKIDAQRQRDIRRNNAKLLFKGLESNTNITPLFDLTMMDCPLFVPVIIKEGRNEIRQKLIDNKIYCPVHWPHPNAFCSSNLYDMELSLICDQRYTESDMERIISVLCD